MSNFVSNHKTRMLVLSICAVPNEPLHAHLTDIQIDPGVRGLDVVFDYP